MRAFCPTFHVDDSTSQSELFDPDSNEPIWIGGMKKNKNDSAQGTVCHLSSLERNLCDLVSRLFLPFYGINIHSLTGIRIPYRGRFVLCRIGKVNVPRKWSNKTRMSARKVLVQSHGLCADQVSRHLF